MDAPQCFLNSTRGNALIRLNKECALKEQTAGPVRNIILNKECWYVFLTSWMPAVFPQQYKRPCANKATSLRKCIDLNKVY